MRVRIADTWRSLAVRVRSRSDFSSSGLTAPPTTVQIANGEFSERNQPPIDAFHPLRGPAGSPFPVGPPSISRAYVTQDPTHPQAGPIDVAAWIDASMPDLLAGRAAPLVDGPLRVVAVPGRGPRSDWHTNAVVELFFQLTGDIEVLLPGEAPGSPARVLVPQGGLWVAPAGIPHAPQRPVGSMGLVVEPARDAGAGESFHWACERCGAVLRRLDGARVDPAELRRARAELQADPAARTCQACGLVAPEPT